MEKVLVVNILSIIVGFQGKKVPGIQNTGLYFQ